MANVLHPSTRNGATRTLRLVAIAGAFAWLAPLTAGAQELVQPKELIVDKRLPAAQAQRQILAARRYDTFWTTGEPEMARAALAPDFIDRTLPRGRVQGIEGPLAASKTFHAAVPDVRCDVEQMIVAGDRVIAHLRFTGHFTGTFNGVHGAGQPIDFIATDIYRIRDGKIADNWHIEDNLTLLQQLGIVNM
ncbi:ester cyclase [Trinickia diaoshuihuensis]|jgi:predicted ester cyclase|uniref:ester cyclase n=1 Tax=Trinickia diaoshuihuensis TaxID=2292265 RepID=UPI000E246199|nr:ester cyclase [Trinickia diaoshuihuensis]